MRGAVPQKGFKMKMSINEGPIVNGVNKGFTISVDHCKELSIFLWGWYKGLPPQVAECIEVILVNPHLLDRGKRVYIRVVLRGSFPHHTQDGGEEPLSWGNNFIEAFYNYDPEAPVVIDSENNLKAMFDEKLLCAINNEILTHQDLLDKLNHLFYLMKKS